MGTSSINNKKDIADGKKVDLGKLYKHQMMVVNVVDSATGEKVEIPHLQDSIRLSNYTYGKGGTPTDDDKIYYKKTIPNDLLGIFVLNTKKHFNARSCVEALGLYNTEQMLKQITNVGTKQDPYSEVEDGTILNNLTFTNYDKGGLSPKNPVTGKPHITYDNLDPAYTRVSSLLGIGLGESTVLNPTFQFNKRDDPRTNPMTAKIGRVYSQRIMNNWPILLLQPGYLKYNTGFFKFLGLFGGAGVADSFIRNGGEGITGVISGAFMTLGDIFSVVGSLGHAIFGSSKLVEFRQATNLYDLYVRNLWIMMASLMGLFDGNKYCGAISNLSLTHVLPTLHMGNNPFTKYQYNQYLPFRIQKGMIGSESFSNSTETNPLQEQMNAQATENDEAGANNNDFVAWGKQKLMGFLGTFSDKYAVLAGNGRVTLPDVFSSSSFSRSISLSFQFHYPYGDTLGKFENIFIQFIALLVLGLPRQTGKFTYTTPFAIRAFVKNHIYINYGMVESLTVTRGGDINDWCTDGFPKTLKVDMAIKDMEPNITIPLGARSNVGMKLGLEIMFPTSGLSEYLMSIAGFSLDEMTHTWRKDRLVTAMSAVSATWSNFTNKDIMLSKLSNWRPITAITQSISGPDYDRYNQTGDYYNMASNTRNEAFAKSQFMDTKYGMYYTMTNGIDAYTQLLAEQYELNEGKAKQSADLRS